MHVDQLLDDARPIELGPPLGYCDVPTTSQRLTPEEEVGDPKGQGDGRKGEKVCAPVGIASNVTPYGFTIAARNSDCAAGQAGFDYVAFGCPQCGSTERIRWASGQRPA